MSQETYNDVTITWTPQGGSAISIPHVSCATSDDAAAVITSALDVDSHTASDGIPNLSVRIEFGGSAPGMLLGQYGTLAITGFPGSITPAAIFEKAVNGQEDGGISGSLLILPTLGFPSSGRGGFGGAGDAGVDYNFNGSTLTFGSSALAGLKSIGYQGTCARVPGTGVDATIRLFRPGLPLEVVTAEVVGACALIKGAVDTLDVAWADGGLAGSMAAGKLMTAPGMAGRLDGDNRSRLTWRTPRVPPS